MSTDCLISQKFKNVVEEKGNLVRHGEIEGNFDIIMDH